MGNCSIRRLTANKPSKSQSEETTATMVKPSMLFLCGVWWQLVRPAESSPAGFNKVSSVISITNSEATPTTTETTYHLAPSGTVLPEEPADQDLSKLQSLAPSIEDHLSNLVPRKGSSGGHGGGGKGSGKKGGSSSKGKGNPPVVEKIIITYYFPPEATITSPTPTSVATSTASASTGKPPKTGNGKTTQTITSLSVTGSETSTGAVSTTTHSGSGANIPPLGLEVFAALGAFAVVNVVV